MSRIGVVALQISLGLFTVLAIDIAGYHLAPRSLNAALEGYRTGRDSAPVGEDLIAKGYYRAHDQRGYDITPDVRAIHEVDGYTYPVWSNSLGCFDREWSEIPSLFDYFAGDSFTWGYAAFRSKFASRFEELTGRPTLKCGVGNSGQLHQFSKFKDITARVGRYPDRVFVAFRQ